MGIRMTFKVFQDRSKGGLSVDGLHRMVRKCFPEISRSDTLKLFEEADVDRNGVITYDEFKQFAEQNEAYTKVFTQVFHDASQKLLKETEDELEEKKSLRKRKGKK